MLFVQKPDVLRGTVVPAQDLHVVFLYLPGLFRDALVAVCDTRKETAPLPSEKAKPLSCSSCFLRLVIRAASS